MAFLSRIFFRRGFFRRRPVFWIFCLLAFLIGAWLITLPVGLRPASTLPVSVSPSPSVSLPVQDQAFFLFSLWWTPYALLDARTDPWYCSILGAPEGVSLLYSTIIPLLSVASAPVTRGLASSLGTSGALILAYNIWVWLSLGLTAFFTALVVRELGGSRGGALIAGALLFYPLVLRSHFEHLNILSAYWVPLVYLLYLRFLRAPGVGRAIAAGVAFAALFYVCAYHTIHALLLVGLDASWRLWTARGPVLRHSDRWVRLIFAGSLVLGVPALSFWLFPGLVLIFGGLGLILCLILTDTLLRRPSPRLLCSAVLGIGVAAALVSPFFIEQRLDSRHEGLTAETTLFSKIYYSNQPLSYVFSPKVTRFFTSRGYLGGDDLMRLSAEGEHAAFAGYAAWLVLLATLFLPRGTGRRRDYGTRYLGFSMIFAIFSFGPYVRWGKEVVVEWLPEQLLVLPPVLFQFLPFLDGYRVFARLAFLVLLCAAIFIGLRWPRTAGRWGARPRIVLTFLAFTMIVGERASVPTLVQSVRIPSLYKRLAERDEKLMLIEFPFHKAQYLFPVTIHRHALANYYVSRVSAERERASLENSFFRSLFLYRHPHPRLAPVFDQPPSPEQLRHDFHALNLDGALVHTDQLVPGDAPGYHWFFTEIIGLELADRDGRLLLYLSPDSKGKAQETFAPPTRD